MLIGFSTVVRVVIISMLFLASADVYSGEDSNNTGNQIKQQSAATADERSAVVLPSSSIVTKNDTNPIVKKDSGTGASTGPGSGIGTNIVTPNPYTVVIGLIFIVGLIFALAWLMRRVGSGALMGGQSMKVLSALSVGPREKVVLVEIAGQQLLLGVAPGRVSHLKNFDQPVIKANESNPGEFSSKLKQLLQQDKSADGSDAFSTEDGENNEKTSSSKDNNSKSNSK